MTDKQKFLIIAEIRTMLAMSDSEREYTYGDLGWKLLIEKILAEVS